MTAIYRELGDKEPLGDSGKELPRFICPCGKRGKGSELLFSPEHNEELADGLQLPLYCPQCLRNGWEGWEWA